VISIVHPSQHFNLFKIEFIYRGNESFGFPIHRKLQQTTTTMKQKLLAIGLILILWCTTCVIAQVRNVSPKRGVAYGYHSKEDMQALSSRISWWYNWSPVPDQGVVGYYQSMGVEFVPMQWGDNPNADYLVNTIPQGAKYLLGFNEPNFGTQSNITAARAAQLWPILEDVARRRNLKLVSPAVNFCGGNCNQTDPVKYLDEFFANYPTCQVDYIAVHWYDCNPGSLKWYLDQFKKYGKPIWLTEFACGEGTDQSLDAQKRFMTEAVTLLESDPTIFRYAWFSGRNDAIPNINLLGANGQLTELGQLYVSLPFGNPQLPGKLEAENYVRMNGVSSETTSDAGGGQNIGWIDNGDWIEFTVDVKEAATYNFNYRVASPNTSGVLHAELDGQRIHANTNMPNTGGWQNWTTVKVSNVSLPVGTHTLRIVFDGGGVNLNYVDVVKNATLPVADFSMSATTVCIGKTVTFTNASTGTITNYSWNFGAGASPATATGVGPFTVTYATAGTPTITLSVTGSAGTNQKSKNLSVTVCNTSINVPGVVEAEKYSNMSGIALENTSDTGGGQNVGWIDAGDWAEYLINVTETSTYEFNYRVASPNNSGIVHAELDGQRIHPNTSIPTTGGWQNWTTVKVSGLNLTAGQHTLRWVADGGGFNVNYIDIRKSVVAAPVADFTISTTTVCSGTAVTVTNASTGSINSYSWNFGANASPATATGVGPFQVVYSVEGIKTITLRVTGDGGTASQSKQVTSQVCNSNLALNKPTFASSVENSNYIASKATDGNASTRWSSAFADPQWIYVDLGQVYNLNKVVLNWEAAAAKSFEVQVSNDAATWTSVYSTTVGSAGVNTITFASSGRYVRVYGTQRTTVYGYSLFEFEVYGSATAMNVASVQTVSSQTVNDVVLYPNPFMNTLMVQFSSVEDVVSVDVYDNSGFVMEKHTASEIADHKLEVGGTLKSGSYFIQIVRTSGIKKYQVMKNQ